MDRLGILQALKKRYHYKTFLEIGVRAGYCFIHLKIDYKDGIDPIGLPANYKMTSDEFFKQIDKNTRYDLIHIDGWHSYAQSMRDVINSLNHLSNNGTITMHDVLPFDQKSACKNGDMHGEVWKTIVELRCTRPDLNIVTVNTDWGCAVIKKDKQKIYIKDSLETCLDWNYKEKHKKELLNIISVAEFKNLLIGDGFTNQDF